MKSGSLSCEQCWELVETGAKTGIECNTCDNPAVMEENLVVVKIYSCSPFKITDFGLVLLDISAIGFLMDVFRVDQNDRESVLERLIFYHRLLREDKELKVNGR